MNDTALPTLKQTATEFLIQTNHQPLYRIAELLIEREQQCTQLGYDRAIAELSNKVLEQEQASKGVAEAAAPSTPLLNSLDSLAAHGEELTKLAPDDVQLGFYVTWFDKDKRAACEHKNLILKLHPVRSRERFVKDIEQAARDIAECEHDQDYSSFELLVEHIAELAGDEKPSAIRGEMRRNRHFFTSEKDTADTEPPAQPLTVYERDQRFQDAYLAIPSDVRGNYPLFEEFKRVLEQKRTPMAPISHSLRNDIVEVAQYAISNLSGTDSCVYGSAQRILNSDELKSRESASETDLKPLEEKWRETAKVGSKTLAGDGATSDVIEAARPAQRANDIGKLIDWVLASSELPIDVRIAAQRLRNNPMPGDGRLQISSPEPDRFQGLVMGDWVGIARRLWQLLDDIDTAGDQIKPSGNLSDSWRAYFERIGQLHSKRHVELKTDGYVLTPFTEGSYEARPTLNNVAKSLNALSKRDGLSLPARREQLEIMLKRYKRTALDEACEPETLDHALTEALAHTVLSLIALQRF